MSVVPATDQLKGEVPAGTPIERLAAAAALADRLRARGDELLDDFVDAARSSGSSWTEVGCALGTSKQAAHERFGRLLAHCPGRRRSGSPEPPPTCCAPRPTKRASSGITTSDPSTSSSEARATRGARSACARRVDADRSRAGRRAARDRGAARERIVGRLAPDTSSSPQPLRSSRALQLACWPTEARHRSASEISSPARSSRRHPSWPSGSATPLCAPEFGCEAFSRATVAGDGQLRSSVPSRAARNRRSERSRARPAGVSAR